MSVVQRCFFLGWRGTWIKNKKLANRCVKTKKKKLTYRHSTWGAETRARTASQHRIMLTKPMSVFFHFLLLSLSQVSLWGKTEKNLQTASLKKFMVAVTIVQLFIFFSKGSVLGWWWTCTNTLYPFMHTGTAAYACTHTHTNFAVTRAHAHTHKLAHARTYTHTHTHTHTCAHTH